MLIEKKLIMEDGDCAIVGNFLRGLFQEMQVLLDHMDVEPGSAHYVSLRAVISQARGAVRVLV